MALGRDLGEDSYGDLPGRLAAEGKADGRAQAFKMFG
jgi:hypothetical protein